MFHRINIQSRLECFDDKNECLYFETIAPYNKEEIQHFAELAAILQLNVLHNPYSDLLGEYFTIHNTKGQNGQYFTPEPVCDLNAKMIMNEDDIGKRVLDPACGSGRMLLSAAKINHRNFFFGADISQTCTKMATLNFFLNGLKGEVAWMNTLSMEWLGGWHINTDGPGIIPIEKEQSQIWSEAPKEKPKPKTPEFDKQSKNKPTEPVTQLTLF